MSKQEKIETPEVKEVKKKKSKEIFSKIFGFIKKHKKIFIILLLLIIVVCVVLKFRKKPDFEVPQTQETEVLSKMDIESTVSASGKIVANDSKTVVSSVSGVKVLTMNYQVGDTVNAGDVICTLDTTEIEYNLADAKTSLSATNVTQGNSIDNSQMSLEDTTLDGLNNTYRNITSVEDAEKLLATKQGELAEANRIYDIEYGIYSDIYSEDEYYDLLEKQANGDISTSELEKLNRLSSAKSSMEQAKSKVDSAQTAVNNAQDALTSAREKYSDNVRDDINSIKKSTNSLEDTYANDSTARLNTQKSIRQYEEQIADATVVAPISGTITAVNYSVGDKYTGDTLVTIEDNSSYKIEANIDEYDISDVAVGQKVTFKTNATGTDVLEGVVSAVAPRATSASSSTTAASSSSSAASYKVTIDILTANDRLRLDMAAKVTIVTNSISNVYGVSSSAIHTDDATGQTYITVQDIDGTSMPSGEMPDLSNGEKPSFGGSDLPTPSKNDSKKDSTEAAEIPTRNIYVTTGVSNDYYTEIESSELSEGLIVLVTNESTENDMSNMMMRMGPMGGM